MINETITSVIQNCRNALINEVSAELEQREEHSVKVDILLSGLMTIKTVFLYGGRVMVLYTEPEGGDADDLECFTLDEITKIIDAI